MLLIQLNIKKSLLVENLNTQQYWDFKFFIYYIKRFQELDFNW